MASQRTVRGLVCALSVISGVVSMSAISAQANLITLNATQDQSEISSFTFDFGLFGGETSAFISDTQYQMEIDPAAAPGTSARFTDYYQTVDSIMLPGNTPTGALTITIDESYGGTYDDVTGTVTTSDLYRIEFTGDLSGFGLFSPVFLPGESSGVIDFESPDAGSIELDWDGTGVIGPPGPNQISFSYTCRSVSDFTVVPEPASLALMSMGAVAILRRRRAA